MTNVSLHFNPQILASSLAIFTLLSAVYGITYVFADSEDDFVSIAPGGIENNPAFAKILENIEKSRQTFSDIQQKMDQEKFIDEQRNIAMNILDRELEQMFEENKDFTSVAAFNNFLKKVSDDNTKYIFQGLFDYQQEKISSAKIVMSDVLRNGGSLQEARNAYHDALQIPRSDMVKLVKDLNVQSGFSNPDIQRHFDENGKLPRYVDEQESTVNFIDLTTSAKNVNSSVNQTTNSTADSITTDPENSQTVLIQKLLDEISVLKNKIKLLEGQKVATVQQAVFEKTDLESEYFADWVSDYTKGKGKYERHVYPQYSVPVNALNQPNSYHDIENSLSLGRGGQVTLGFSDSITDKLIVYETTNDETLTEHAIVEVSDDDQNWIALKHTQYNNDGSHVHQYGYDLSDVGCVSHVRITDTTGYQKSDGFDIDAVGATKLCSETT
ncbi:hypothetical protein [Nitrosopumilus sp.]|uniref:hypothetical protein n=1 Tax=Nitrosopumilus sp. TaxID=2024843 RepID=UPI003B5C9664